MRCLPGWRTSQTGFESCSPSTENVASTQSPKSSLNLIVRARQAAGRCSLSGGCRTAESTARAPGPRPRCRCLPRKGCPPRPASTCDRAANGSVLGVSVPRHVRPRGNVGGGIRASPTRDHDGLSVLQVRRSKGSNRRGRKPGPVCSLGVTRVESTTAASRSCSAWVRRDRRCGARDLALVVADVVFRLLAVRDQRPVQHRSAGGCGQHRGWGDRARAGSATRGGNTVNGSWNSYRHNM